MARLRFLVVDACVLIDFVEVDPSLITLASRHVGEIYVATPVLAEVEGLDASEATSLGIKLYEPPLDMLAHAAATRGRLSFPDRLCLAIAKAKGWTCVSNDKQLREACKVEKVSVLWEFEVLGLLVDARALTATAARNLAKMIATANKRIGADVLARFIAKLD